MQFEIRNLSSLVYAEYNPRKALKPEDEEYQNIKRSIKEFGYVDPIIVNSDNTIIGGHQRATVLKDLGFEEVEVVILDLEKNKEKALNMALNKISGEWDPEKLQELLKELENEIDLAITGFNQEEIDNILKEIEEIPTVEEDNYNEDPPEEPKSKPGEIYKLGEHRLMCGDSTDPEQLKTLMDAADADLIVTDPPYNIAYEGGTAEKLTIKNDNMANDEFEEFLKKSFCNMEKHLKPGGAFYIWHADTATLNFRNACNENSLDVKQCLIWVKNTFTLGRQDYQWRHEPCLYGWKPGAAHYFITERNHSTVIEDQLDLESMKKTEMKELLETILQNPLSTILRENKPAKSKEHPTMKPIKLLATQIANSSRKYEAVLDPFGGSGSTLIACEQLNRKCYMMELDPKYVDVIINRWEKYTGEKAEKIID